ncbi:MAG TPA: flagellar biosynthetic protein FliO [Lysobacter sp.]|nr:flagellar biosynthetic protein FliO [Lysobacter sp.]
MSEALDIVDAAVATSMDSRLRGNDGAGNAAGVAVVPPSSDAAMEATALGSRFRGNDGDVGSAASTAVAAPSGDVATEATSMGSRLRGNDGGVDDADVSSRHPRAGGDPGTLAPATAPNATTTDTAIDTDTATAESADAFSQVTARVDSTAEFVAIPLARANTAAVTQASAPVFAPPSSGAGAVGGGVMALLLVVGLILALAWLARRMPGVGAATVGNPALRVVALLALGPRERVVVVEVGQTQLLLSVGAGGTRALHTLAEPLPATDATPSPFASLLAQHFGKKS